MNDKEAPKSRRRHADTALKFSRSGNEGVGGDRFAGENIDSHDRSCRKLGAAGGKHRLSFRAIDAGRPSLSQRPDERRGESSSKVKKTKLWATQQMRARPANSPLGSLPLERR